MNSLFMMNKIRKLSQIWHPCISGCMGPLGKSLILWNPGRKSPQKSRSKSWRKRWELSMKRKTIRYMIFLSHLVYLTQRMRASRRSLWHYNLLRCLTPNISQSSWRTSARIMIKIRLKVWFKFISSKSRDLILTKDILMRMKMILFTQFSRFQVYMRLT